MNENIDAAKYLYSVILTIRVYVAIEPRVCVCVCLCVCLNVCFSTAKTDETILMKLSTKDLRDFHPEKFLELWIFKFDDIITAIFCYFKPAHSRSQLCQSLKVRLIIWNVIIFNLQNTQSIVKSQIDSFYLTFVLFHMFL